MFHLTSGEHLRHDSPTRIWACDDKIDTLSNSSPRLEVGIMPVAFDQRWESLIRQKRTSLSKLILDGSFRSKDYESFLAYLNSVALYPAFRNRDHTLERFIASLDSLRSFTTAASIASRDGEGIQMIWASLHAVTEVRHQPLYISGSCALKTDFADVATQSASRSSKIFETVLEQMADLNQTLAPIGAPIDLFSDQPQLHWFLQNLFDDYLSFCTRCLYQIRAQPQHKKFVVAFAILAGLALLFVALVQVRQPKLWPYPTLMIMLSSCCLVLEALYLYCKYEGFKEARKL